MHCILEHHCLHPDSDNGLPLICGCERRISRRQAEELIASGHAAWKKLPDGSASDRDLLVFTRARFPRATTVSDANIERAYVLGSEYEKRRIKEFKTARYPVA